MRKSARNCVRWALRPHDVTRVELTHLHIDHDGGLAHFPRSEILVSPGELQTAGGWIGRMVPLQRASV
jgi:glyoxylase-like metal-dependent hydrolase (beta-lactamase superfamily II)